MLGVKIFNASVMFCHLNAVLANHAKSFAVVEPSFISDSILWTGICHSQSDRGGIFLSEVRLDFQISDRLARGCLTNLARIPYRYLSTIMKSV